MSFIWPSMLLSLLALPALILLYQSVQQRRRKLAAQFGMMGFAPSRPERLSGARRNLPTAFYFAGLAMLLFSLARPQASVSLPRVEGTVMLLFDVSGSMAATDFDPSRMEAAKRVASEFVLSQPPTVRVGVVAFSTSGFAVQPPTNNQDEILAAIERLSPQQGTSLGQGILASLNALAADRGQQISIHSSEAAAIPDSGGDEEEKELPAVIVMLTDGENNHLPDPVEAAQAAAEQGVQIFAVGIGSAAGTELKVNGFTVFTRLDEETMRMVADAAGGQYFSAENEDELKQIYNDVIPTLVVRNEEIEITALIAGASILVLVIGGLLSLIWFGRVL